MFSEYLETVDKLNHLNVSGMNMEEQSVLQICELVQKSKNILVLHLSDNRVMNNLKLEVQDIFRIQTHKQQSKNEKNTKSSCINNLFEPNRMN